MDLEGESMNSFWTIFNENDQCMTEESLRIFNFRLSIQDLAKVQHLTSPVTQTKILRVGHIQYSRTTDTRWLNPYYLRRKFKFKFQSQINI
jgi:hypothetical protein